MGAMSDDKNESQKTREQRSTRLVKLELSNDRVGNMTATIRNITRNGAGIKTDTQLMAGESVTISIAHLDPFAAIVRWYKLGSAGLEFEKPFDLELLQFNKTHEGEGIYKNTPGYRVFDRFKSNADFRRPGLGSPRKK
jgi:hypothetical protein